MKVSNRGCIRRLSLRSLLASRTRNIVAVLAIALTTVLFTSLFTIALSINEGIQQNNFRQAGGWNHGSFKYLTQEQFQTLKSDPLIAQWGVGGLWGCPPRRPSTNPMWRSATPTPTWPTGATATRWRAACPGRAPARRPPTPACWSCWGWSRSWAPSSPSPLRWTAMRPPRALPCAAGGRTTRPWWPATSLIPESRVDAILEEVGVTPPGSDGMTGSWNLDVMLRRGARSIAADLEEILASHGYQSETPGETYISTGVNWGYTGAQLSDKLDPTVTAILTGVLLLILLTGYLIIYNVFQISVAGDIRFYGLLKTIGTTPRQLRRIIRTQALLLSLVGIPMGLVLGWLLGGVLTPVIAAQLNGVTAVVSVSPLLFAGAAVFALVTVLISCRRPGRLAGKVSPVEAVRYAEGRAPKGKGRRGGKGVSLLSMAWANLGRSRGKTAVTILSLALAVVLLTLTVTFTKGFDMDKYVSTFTASDFILADAGQFQTGGESFNEDMAIPQQVIDAVDAQGGVTGSGRIYGKTAPALEFVTEAYYRSMWGRWSTQEQLDSMVAFKDRTEDGLLADQVQLYGMEPFALDYLTVLDGDLSKLNDPGGSYIAAVYSADDYGNALMDSHWARLGDTVTLRYVEEFAYYNPNTGEVYGPLENVPEGAAYAERAVKYRDVDYTVAALVTVPSALSYRYYGADEFILGAEAFVRDTGTDALSQSTPRRRPTPPWRPSWRTTRKI